MSRVHTESTANRMWWSLIDLLCDSDKTDSRNGGCREIVGWAGGLTDPTHCVVSDQRRRLSPGYACGELLWYLMGRDDQDMISAYASQYARFCNNGAAMGAYGRRWSHNPGIRAKGGGRSSLQWAVDLLSKKSNDRRAVVTMFDSGDIREAFEEEWNDIPCTISMQFLVRDGALHMITNMRSNDAWLGTPYDVFCFCHIQMLVASALGCRLGAYRHFVGSMHLYDANYEKAREVSCGPRSPFQSQLLSIGACQPSREEAINFFADGVPIWVIGSEAGIRLGNETVRETIVKDLVHRHIEEGSWWAGLLLACARKLGCSVCIESLPAWARSETR